MVLRVEQRLDATGFSGSDRIEMPHAAAPTKL
jgi:hypothetical protein